MSRRTPHDPIWPTPRRVHIARGIVAKTQVVLDQVGFRFRDDDGGEAAATWLAAENTDVTLAPDTPFRVRIVLDDTVSGGDNNVQLRLQVSLNGGAFQDVDGTSTIVQSVSSVHFADEDATTRQLTSGSGTFVAGAMDDNGLAGENNQIDYADGLNEVTEIEYAVQIVGADVSDTDTIDFRIVRGDGTLLGGTYVEIPRATVSAVSATYSQTHYRIRSGDSVGLNVDSGWAAAEDVDATIGRGVPFRIRFKLAETSGNGPSNEDLHVQVRRNGGAWTDVQAQLRTGATLGVLPPAVASAMVVDSDQYADGDATTQLLTNDGGGFAAGVGDEETPNNDGNSFQTSISNQETEIEVALQIMSTYDDPAVAEVVSGDTLEFRLVRGALGSETPLDTYGQTPTITVADTDGYIGGTFSETPGRVAAATGGDLYFLCEVSEQTPRPTIRKSSDGGATWRAMDLANSPSQIDLEGADVHFDGTIIHVAQADGSDDIFYHAFDTSTDSWTTVDEAVTTGIAMNSNPQGVAIVVRSDGDKVIFYHRDDGAVDHLYYKIDSGAGWGSEQTVDAEASHWAKGVVASRGASDKIHLYYIMTEDTVDGTVYHRSLDSADNLSAREAVRSVTDSDGFRTPFSVPVYWDDGGDEKIMVVVHDDFDKQAYSYVVTNDGTHAAAKQVSDQNVAEAVGASADNSAIHLDLDGTDQHVIYADESTNDIWHDEAQNDGGWGVDVEVADGVQAAWLRGLIYENPSAEIVYAIFYDEQIDGGTGQVRYTEHVIRSTSTAGEVSESASANVAVAGEVSGAASADVSARGESAESATARIALAGQVEETATADVALPGESQDAASARVGVSGETAETATADMALAGQQAQSGTANVALPGETSELASLRAAQRGEQSATASANISAVASGEVSEAATADVALAGEEPATATARVALAGQSSEPATADLQQTAEVSETATADVALAGEATAPTSARVALPSEVQESASLRAAIHGDVEATSSADIEAAGETPAEASAEISVAAESSETATARIVLAGQVAAAASTRLEQTGEQTTAATVNIAGVATGEVSEEATADVALAGETSGAGSVRLALPGETAASATAEIAVAGETQAPSTIEAALPGQQAGDASARVALAGSISEQATARVVLSGRTLADASTDVAQAGEVAGAASVNVTGLNSGQVSGTATARVALAGETSSATSADVLGAGNVDAAASLETALPGESAASASTDVIASGRTASEATARVSVAGSVAAAATARISLVGAQPAAGSARIAQRGASAEAASVSTEQTGEQTASASMRIQLVDVTVGPIYDVPPRDRTHDVGADGREYDVPRH